MSNPFTIRPIHLHMKIIGKSQGYDMARFSSYRFHKRFTFYGNIIDTRKKTRVDTDVVVVNNLQGYDDMQRFINDIEAANMKKNARYGREVVCGIPIEFTKEQRVECVEKFMHSMKVILDMPGIAAIHEINDLKHPCNPHAHIFIPDRHIENGQIVGKNRKHNLKVKLIYIRQIYTQIVNEMISKYHPKSDRFTCLSYEELGLPLVSMRKINPKLSEAKKRKLEDANEKIREHNQQHMPEARKILAERAELRYLRLMVKKDNGREQSKKAHAWMSEINHSSKQIFENKAIVAGKQENNITTNANKKINGNTRPNQPPNESLTRVNGDIWIR